MSTRHVPTWTGAVLAVVMLLGACAPAQDAASGDRPTEVSWTDVPSPAAAAEPKPALPTGPTPPAPVPTSPAPEEEGTAAPTPAPEASEAVALEPVGEDDTGEPVRALQARLDQLGYAPGPIDGVYGSRTAVSVAAYQHEAGLDPTGRADAPTVTALEEGDHEVHLLAAGDRGDDVRALQAALADGPFDPGTVDGVYGGKTLQAVYALEKLAGIAVDGVFDGTDRHALDRLADAEIGAAAHHHERRWVEVDLSRQLLSIYDEAGTPLLVSHVSTGNGERWCNETAGCRVARTPTGSFTITRRIEGWRESSLDIGRLYNPLYFRGGVALHGALAVPTHPASHGCVRVPMHIAEYLPELLPNGTPVEVRD